MQFLSHIGCNHVNNIATWVTLLSPYLVQGFLGADSITRQIWGIWKLRLAYSPETPNLGQNRWCFVPCDLEFDGWPWKMIGHLSFAVSSCAQHFIAIGEFKLELQSGNAQFGSNSTIFRAMWPWNRWFKTWVTVRKRPIWVKFADF